jgi:hypothetical protein
MFLCDIAELCTGIDAHCPTDLTLGLGDPCEDGDACTTGEQCLAGLVCGGSGPLDCDDGNRCTADSCDSVTGCGHAVIQSCGADLPTSSSWSLAVLGFVIVSTGALLATRTRRFRG